MKFEWYLALRYFQGRRRDSRFLSFIKIMAITGVAIGSAGLLIALSIVHGFKTVINDKVLGYAPNITVTSYMAEPLFRADTLQVFLGNIEGVSQAQPVIIGDAMIQSVQDVSGTLIKGVDPAGDVTNLRDYINAGEYNLGMTERGLPGIIIGNRLARSIGAGVGNVITTYAVDGIPTPFNTPEIQQFVLTGIYQTGIDRFDDSFALVDIIYARKLFGYGMLQASGVDVNVANNADIERVYAVIRDATRFPYITENIYQTYRNIFAWVDLQEETIPFIISVMVIVAAFNLIGTILMMVLERIRDIGILKTMGARSRAIRKVFLLEGLFVAGVGLGLGIMIAMLFNWLQGTYKIIPLSEENYYMSYAPVEPHLIDFFIVAAVTFILCAMASWLPARIAAKTDPVQVLSFGK
jgi:lipoprotein-releasing system permease protein